MKRLVKTLILFALIGAMLLSSLPVSGEGIEDWACEEPALRYGDEGELVARLQYELCACGYLSGEHGGLFDTATFRAVRALQAELGVAVDGVYGPNTHGAYVAAVEAGAITPDYPWMHELEGLVIGIDPGHQISEDTELEFVSPLSSILKKARMTAGSMGIRTGVCEHSINLEVAKYLRDKLEAHGATVVMTRTDPDVTLSNMERAEIMNDAQVDCWLRIHCNYSRDASLKGARVLMPAGIANLSIASASRRLGYCVIEAFCEETGSEMLAPHFMTDQTGFNWSESPVVTLELGYLSNSMSDLKLCRSSYQKECAEGIFRGIAAYFGGLDPYEAEGRD